MSFLVLHGQENISKRHSGAEFHQKGRSCSVLASVEFSFQDTWVSHHQMQTLIPKITNLQGKKLKIHLLHSPSAQRRQACVSQS